MTNSLENIVEIENSDLVNPDFKVFSPYNPENSIGANENPNFINKIKVNLKKHLVDTTAMITVGNPIFSVLETTLGGLSVPISLNAKFIGCGLAYLGLGSLYSRLRDYSRKSLKITGESKKSFQAIHDISFNWAYGLALTPAIYYASGSRNLNEMMYATALTLLGGTFSGYPNGLAIDAFRDFTGIEESKRLPEIIKDSQPWIKKSILGLLAISSLAFTAGYYYMVSK